MEEWQKRVFTEREELAMKISKLESFLDTKDGDFDLLRKQLAAMSAYYDILDQRVEEF